MTDSIDRLYDAVLEAMDAHPSSSRTARLLRAGRSKIAKKVAEEAVEVVIEAMLNHRDAVVRESADLLYNLAVLWASVDVEPKDVWKEMQRRERLFGIAEKLAKQRSLLKARRKTAARGGRANAQAGVTGHRPQCLQLRLRMDLDAAAD